MLPKKEDMMITCKSGVTIRMPVNGISEQGRATQGVKLIRLDEGDEIAAIIQMDETGGNGNGIGHSEIPSATDTDLLNNAEEATGEGPLPSEDVS
jgi:DNA gyrase subunit A